MSGVSPSACEKCLAGLRESLLSTLVKSNMEIQQLLINSEKVQLPYTVRKIDEESGRAIIDFDRVLSMTSTADIDTNDVVGIIAYSNDSTTEVDFVIGSADYELAHTCRFQSALTSWSINPDEYYECHRLVDYETGKTIKSLISEARYPVTVSDKIRHFGLLDGNCANWTEGKETVPPVGPHTYLVSNRNFPGKIKDFYLRYTLAAKDGTSTYCTGMSVEDIEQHHKQFCRDRAGLRNQE